MRTLGLLGGMSFESTLPYYRIVNERVREKLGGLHSAKLVLYSVDFAEIERLQHVGDWATAGRVLADAAQALERAGAEALVLCTNTMHRVLDAIEAAIGIPALHIADATARRIRASGREKVGLLATRFTMEQDFYRERLREVHGLQVIVPDADDRSLVHDVIYDELCRGVVRDSSREAYRRIMDALVASGADAIILGCTEIGLLVNAENSPLPAYDTMALHAAAITDFILYGV